MFFLIIFIITTTTTTCISLIIETFFSILNKLYRLLVAKLNFLKIIIKINK